MKAGTASSQVPLATDIYKFCGRAFNTVAASTTHTTVCATATPYEVTVNFDKSAHFNAGTASMATNNECQGIPSGTLGFGLNVFQD